MHQPLFQFIYLYNTNNPNNDYIHHRHHHHHQHHLSSLWHGIHRALAFSSLTQIYIPGWREILWEHNTMYPARPWTTQSISALTIWLVKGINHEASTPSTIWGQLHNMVTFNLMGYCIIPENIHTLFWKAFWCKHPTSQEIQGSTSYAWKIKNGEVMD